MADGQEINAQQIIERIRKSLGGRKGEDVFSNPIDPPPGESWSAPQAPGGATSSLSGSLPKDPVSADLASLHRNYDIYYTRFSSHRRVLGPCVVFAKKMFRKLLTPILMRQVTYNAANTRVVTHLVEELAQLRAQVVALGQQQVQLREESLAVPARALEALDGQLTQVRAEVSVSQAEALQAMSGANPPLQP